MGIAKLYENNIMMSEIGCRDYMPPEFYTRQYTKKLDIYTYGLTVNELYDGSHVLIKNTREIQIQREADVFFYFVRKCLSRNPNHRPEAKQLEKDLCIFEKMIDSLICKNLQAYNNKSAKQKNQVFRTIYYNTLEIFQAHNERPQLVPNIRI